MNCVICMTHTGVVHLKHRKNQLYFNNKKRNRYILKLEGKKTAFNTLREVLRQEFCRERQRRKGKCEPNYAYEDNVSTSDFQISYTHMTHNSVLPAYMEYKAPTRESSHAHCFPFVLPTFWLFLLVLLGSLCKILQDPPVKLQNYPCLQAALLCVHAHCSAVSYSLQPPRTVAHQAPLFTGLSPQEYWHGLLFPPPGDLPHPGIELQSPVAPADSLLLSHLGSPIQLSLSPLILNELSLVFQLPHRSGHSGWRVSLKMPRTKVPSWGVNEW